MHCIIFKKGARFSGIFLAEVYESTTYESTVELTTITEADIEKILSKPSVSDDDNYSMDSVVIFDLKTTGLGTSTSKETTIL